MRGCMHMQLHYRTKLTSFFSYKTNENDMISYFFKLNVIGSSVFFFFARNIGIDS